MRSESLTSEDVTKRGEATQLLASVIPHLTGNALKSNEGNLALSLFAINNFQRMLCCSTMVGT